jgi:hypothetical protein
LKGEPLAESAHVSPNLPSKKVSYSHGSQTHFSKKVENHIAALSEAQKWNTKVSDYLRTTCGAELATEFLALSNVVEKRQILWGCKQQVIEKAVLSP